MDRVEGLAGDGAPVGLRILDGSDSSARVRAGYWPAGLGDPDPLAGGDGVDLVARGVYGLPEDGTGVGNGGVLKVWVSSQGLALNQTG